MSYLYLYLYLFCRDDGGCRTCSSIKDLELSVHGLSGKSLGRVQFLHISSASLAEFLELTLSADKTESGKPFRSETILSEKKWFPYFNFHKLLEELKTSKTKTGEKKREENKENKHRISKKRRRLHRKSIKWPLQQQQIIIVNLLCTMPLYGVL